jgi:hypothetical protein
MASSAFYFSTLHSKRIIRQVNKAVLTDWFKETWPSATAVEFSITPEKRVSTYGAMISACLTMLIIFPGARPFCSFFAGYVVNI